MRFLLFFVLQVGWILSSHATFLGEWVGEGSHQVTKTVEGNTSSYEGHCRLALNLTRQEDVLAMPFASVTCDGMDAWNESWKVERRGSELFYDNQKVGSISDSEAHLVLNSSQKVEYTNTIYGSDCNVLSIEKKKVNLQKSRSWKIHFLSDSKIQILREETREVLADIYLQDPFCPNAYAKTVVASQSDRLSANLKKKSAIK